MKRKSNIIILTFIAAALFMSGCGYDKERYPGGVVKAVSYTHLDVYKRQFLFCR